MTTVFRAITIDPVLNYAGILGANASFLSRKPSVKPKQREETPSAGAQMWIGSRWLRKKAEEKCDFRGGWRLRTDRPEHSAAGSISQKTKTAKTIHAQPPRITSCCAGLGRSTV